MTSNTTVPDAKIKVQGTAFSVNHFVRYKQMFQYSHNLSSPLTMAYLHLL